MHRKASLEEAKMIFGRNAVFERGDEFFVPYFGTYEPQLTFVVRQTFNLTMDEQLENPIECFSEREVIDMLHLGLGPRTKFILGDWWRSGHDKIHFRVLNPVQAKAILVCEHWQANQFKADRPDPLRAYRIPGVEHYVHTTGETGRSGFDYWLLPLGFVYQGSEAECEAAAIRMPEIQRELCEKLRAKRKEAKHAIRMRHKQQVP